MNKFLAGLYFTACFVLTGCGGGSNSSPTPTSATIGGTVSGLPAGLTLLLTNNDSETISVTQNANFTFAKPIAENGSYNVLKLGEPAGSACTISNGSGTVAHGANSITNVSVTCTPGAVALENFWVGVTVTGLLSGNTVTFKNNGQDILTANDNGLFVFPQVYALEEAIAGVGGGYNVVVQANPSGQTCTLSNASGAESAAQYNDFVNVVATCK